MTHKANRPGWYRVFISLAIGLAVLSSFMFGVAVVSEAGYYPQFTRLMTGCDPRDELYDICRMYSDGILGEITNLFTSERNQDEPILKKPVIYLYPETTTDVLVQLDYDGTLIADHPPYDTKIGGWRVTAQPDSTLTNHTDGKEYSYLFWEGEPRIPTDWDLSTGFVVAGSDTREFLQEKLADIGLTPKEYNEFIVYWYPKMKDNPYNLIHFADTQYIDTAPLTITPTPDSMLRVFMVYTPLTHPVDVTPQAFTPFTRTGFTVVEWGGTEVRQKS